MTEREPTEDKPEEKVAGHPRAKQPACKQEIPRSTLDSAPAKLPAPKTVRVDYRPVLPSRRLEEPPEEPSKKVPVVPPGDYAEDTDESPPVHFDDPEQDAAEEPSNETTGAGKQPSD